MDFFKLQRDIDSAGKALPGVIEELQKFRAEIAAHRIEIKEHSELLRKVLTSLEMVSHRQTEIELDIMGVKGPNHR